MNRKVRGYFSLKHINGFKGKAFISLPPNTYHQTISNIKFISGAPTKIYDIPDTINKIAFWDNVSEIEFDFHMQLAEMNLQDVQKAQIDKSYSNAQLKFYLKNEKFFEEDKSITELAYKITNGLNTDLSKIQAIFSWQTNNMNQTGKLISGPGVLNAIKDLDGNCGSFSWLFVSLCRSIGIPARLIMGGLALNNSEGYHAWSEAFIDNKYWIPVDASIAHSMIERPDGFKEFGFPTNPEFYCGGIANNNIVFTEGMNLNLKQKDIPVPKGLEVVDFMQPGADNYIESNSLSGYYGLYYPKDIKIGQNDIVKKMYYNTIQ